MPSVQTNAVLLLKAIYDEVGGDSSELCETAKTAAQIGMEVGSARAAAHYLIGKALLRDHRVISELPLVSLTAAGVDAIEAALDKPAQATRYFPAIVNILSVNNLNGGAIQQGTVQSAQSGHQFGLPPSEMGTFARDLTTLAQTLKQSATTTDELVAVGKVAEAAQAAQANDAAKVSSILRGLGGATKWVGGLASGIASRVVVEAIMRGGSAD
jgi:hypothetical protein